jgi:protein-disulfide isomerase
VSKSKREQQARLKEKRRQAEAKEKKDQQRKKLIYIVGGVAAVALVAVWLVVLFGGGSGGDASQISEVETVNQNLNNIEQNGAVLGDPKASVQLSEFGDLQCPACRQFNTEVFPELLEQVRQGELKIRFENYAILGPDSETAARAALAAEEQDRAWHFIELFYYNQGVEHSGYAKDPEFLESIAEAAGLDLAKWQQDLSENQPAYTEAIQTSTDAAAAEGFNSTPSFIIEGPEGREILSGVPNLGELEFIIDKVR